MPLIHKINGDNNNYTKVKVEVMMNSDDDLKYTNFKEEETDLLPHKFYIIFHYNHIKCYF